MCVCVNSRLHFSLALYGNGQGTTVLKGPHELAHLFVRKLFVGTGKHHGDCSIRTSAKCEKAPVDGLETSIVATTRKGHAAIF